MGLAKILSRGGRLTAECHSNNSFDWQQQAMVRVWQNGTNCKQLFRWRNTFPISATCLHCGIWVHRIWPDIWWVSWIQ